MRNNIIHSNATDTLLMFLLFVLIVKLTVTRG